jgi:dihydrofolate reductase
MWLHLNTWRLAGRLVEYRCLEGGARLIAGTRCVRVGSPGAEVASTSCISPPNPSEAAMSQVRVHNFSISLDGFGTGEGITFDAPFGHAGHRLHEWYFATRFWRSMVGDAGGTVGVDHSFAERIELGFGAEIMGRGKFGAQTGPWTDVGTDDEWRGWWGPNPPFHTPVFVLTHHARPPIEMEGGTVFHFIDASPQEALDLAREAAGGLDVRIGGGPTVVRDFLVADLIDTLHVVQVPILLGRGARLWDGLEGIEERYNLEVVSSPSGVTHLTFTRR